MEGSIEDSFFTYKDPMIDAEKKAERYKGRADVFFELSMRFSNLEDILFVTAVLFISLPIIFNNPFTYSICGFLWGAAFFCHFSMRHCQKLQHTEDITSEKFYDHSIKLFYEKLEIPRSSADE